jgi:hypothetical protein
MLQIQRNQASTLIVTVTEMQTLPAPFWLFEFTHQQSFESVTCILDNISTGIARYDEFVITDGVDVVFPYNGDYTYRIYEQDSDTNLDPIQAHRLCEEGLAHVYEDPTDNIEYYTEIIHNIYE